MQQLPNDYLSSESELPITQETSGYLIETSKWAKFIAITFYVITGIAILIMLIWGSYLFNTVGTYRSRVIENTITIAIISMIIATIVVAITYYFLLVFANKMRMGVETENIEQVNVGLGSLKVHFIIIGILLMLGIFYSLYTLSNVYA